MDTNRRYDRPTQPGRLPRQRPLLRQALAETEECTMVVYVDRPTFRHQRNEQQAKQVFRINLGFAVCLLAKAIYERAWGDLGVNATFLALQAAPGVLCFLERPQHVSQAFTVGHLLGSLITFGVGLGYFPLIKDAKPLLEGGKEVIPEILIAIFAQASLPVLAVLHALRQWSMATLCARSLGTAACSKPHRWVLNWLVLMSCQCACELRTRYLYHKSAARAARSKGADVVIQQEAASSGTAGSQTSKMAAAAGQLQPAAGSAAQHAQQAARPSSADPGPVLQADAAVHDASVVGVAAQAPQASSIGQPASQNSEAMTAALAAIARSNTDTYRSRNRTKMYIKLQDLEPEQLPQEFFTAMQTSLAPCMPGTQLVGLGVRHGCVVLALDLVAAGASENPNNPDNWTSPLVFALSSALAACQAGRLLQDKSALTTQAGSDLASFAWDSSAHEYVRSESVGAQLVALLQLAALCRLVSAGPVVQCLPAAASARNQRVQLQLQLTVPSHSRLLGWQPAGAAVSAEAEALILTSDVPQLDVLVLVRRQCGAYLCVTLRLLSASQTHTAGSETWTVRVQAEVDVPCQDATGLSVEMWAKAPATDQAATGSRPELLVAHSPVLVLTAQQQPAAAELLQLVQTMGGVSAIWDLPVQSQDTAHQSGAHAVSTWLHDLALWLSYMSGTNDSMRTDAEPADAMAAVGNSLLVHAVRRGWSNLAQLIVSAMVQSSASAQAVGEQGAPWFLAAAKPADAGIAVAPLLRAAMASGNADMLEKVLRWGQVYGGRQWRWPWSLTNGSGHTALHLAAAQSQASACLALLDTVKRMLPEQIPAAHTAWLHEAGRARVTPCQVFVALHSDHATDSLWEQRSSEAAKPAAAAEPQAVAGGSSATTSRARTGTGSVSAIVRCTSRQLAPGGPTDSEPLPGFWALMRQAWRWKQGPEYDAWALKQLSGLVSFLARSLLFFWTPVFIIQTWQAGSLARELPYIVTTQSVYLIMALASLGVKRLGTWQDWMLLVPILHTVSYTYISLFPAKALPLWDKTGTDGSDVIFQLLMVAPQDQNPLPYSALVKIPLGIAYGFAFKSAGLPHPFLRSLIIHSTALLIITLIRTYQLRSFERWLRDSARKKDVSATAASSSGQASTEGPAQQQEALGKAKVE